MPENNKRIIIWCGSAANQKALANKIAKQFNVVGIVVDTHFGTGRKQKKTSLVKRVVDRIRFAPIYNAWKRLMRIYDSQFALWPDVPTIKVNSINESTTEKFSKELKPDLIIVSGTTLIKEPLVCLPISVGIMNLHTGLSPYVKGGPNCTNWCIANGDFHLVGNTIMWLNVGIDSGNIITTDTIDIRNAKSLDEAHYMVMEHAHDLYVKSIEYIMTNNYPYQSVAQTSIANGSLYLTKMWTTEKKLSLLRNWKKRNAYTSGMIPKTIPLPK
ncbi:MAG: hypothetical protein JST62_12575 [Bacteroidetes bacterium]|nr:hypothetical protein [Bacteroidota bacterium]